jgi:DNA polymerase-3 subunit alpha
MDAAREAAKWYRDVFQGRFFLELQENGLPQQMLVNARFQELARELGIGLVATADVHYLRPEDAYAQEVLLAIQTGRTMDKTRDDIPSTGFWFKDQETIRQEFAHCPEAIANTMEIARQCNFDFQFKDASGKKIYHFAKFDVPEGKTQVEQLNELAAQGLAARLDTAERLGRTPFTPEEREKYRARLDRELKVINDMGFTSYFLIVSDFIGAAKDRGIPVGPGRGSGAGSLVAYALRITELDPIEHGLLFERFLNPERVSLPDFDVDFCMDRRPEIIQYVVDKYGAECVAQIITFGKLQARGVIRDVGRAFGMPIPEIDRMAKLVPETLNITLDEALEQEPRLRQLIEQDPKLGELFGICRQLEGLGRHASIHAAGLVISNRPMVEHCALFKGKNDELVIQFDMNNADKIGLIKFDFLGLKTLTFLRSAETLIQRRHPKAQFSLEKIPFYDKKTYEMLARGDTAGVFQLESSGMQELMKKIRPDAFADIVASNALYRPGPLESGMVDDYIARKHGQTPVVYDFDELKPVLSETYGVIVYQEQVQQIAMRLASYTAGGADLLRRAMGKKKPEEMAKQKAIFLEGGTKNSFDKAKLEKIFDLMEKFAGYGFNKSHAAAYSLITVQTAFIKAHYPEEFYAALLSIERENTDKITKYIADAKKRGIAVLPPDINESMTDFAVLADKKIRFGLGAIKGVGQIAIEEVLEARKKDGPFSDLFDLAARCNGRMVNKRVLEAFTKAGALDTFGVNRASLFKAIDPALEHGAARQKQRDDLQNSFLDLLGGDDEAFAARKVEYPNEPPWPRAVELRFEKDTTGFFLTGHPLDEFRAALDRYTTMNVAECHAASSAKEVLIGAEVISIREIVTRRGDRMAFVNLGDQTGEIEAVVFSDLFLENEEVWRAQEPVWIKGQLEVTAAPPGSGVTPGAGGGGGKLVLSKKSSAAVLPLRFAFEAMAREMHLEFLSQGQPMAVGEFEHRLERLRTGLRERHVKGGGFVYLHVGVPGTARTTLRLKETVPLTRETVHWVRELFPAGEVSVDFR